MFNKLFAVVLAALAAGPVPAAEAPDVPASSAEILWRVEFFNLNRASLGTVEMRITTERAKSCLGDADVNTRRVEFLGRDGLSSAVKLAGYGVASFDGGDVKVDLSGGVCDADLVMEGALDGDGSSMGSLYTLSLGGGHDVGTYRAVRIAAPSRHAPDR